MNYINCAPIIDRILYKLKNALRTKYYRHLQSLEQLTKNCLSKEQDLHEKNLTKLREKQTI